ncbi:methionine aminotransferase [Ralstonia pseudosolanacearum]|uniref:methionine aminotransferase n=1 Tax=Ralstonia pseudosolanacearum TaxID=1310165 RepID=UPI0013E3E24D|nr:methionine aminotransferase [Ralstonia pseudosolanacearum]MCK4140433.1 aminotransferase class I/II-fold pyridoxal phosphate-dependent enzyme [Ralstonia pseudosolanacearum]QVX41911.1 aminotransferase class I/II-fold pyridoxal phosphate-dependent enzyme [Ralstonia solanacearum]UQY85684.1 aminotransferase class I/II-fold pyridoxal phosphate-dependent enzyme [Ralstonia pseudosolanacearum]
MSSIVSDSRLPHIKGSIFADMSRAAKKHGAVNLSQGFPDFAPDRRLLDALTEAAQGNYHQYGLPEGSEALRQSIARMFWNLYQLDLSSETEITITAGATQAISAAVGSLIHAGEEVIFLSPAFESYAPAILLAGAVPVCVDLQAPKFEIDWDEVEDRISPRTRMIIVNSPHNPSGRCWTAGDVARLAELADRHNLLVLSDEVYHNIVFEQPHITAISDEQLRKRTVVVGSLGKTMHVTGWRIGYAIGAAALTHEIRKILQFNTYAAPTPLQQAMAVVLDDAAYRDLPELFRRKRDRFLKGLEGSRFTFAPTGGGYFQLADYSAISDLPDAQFANRLIETHGVACLPISGFGSQYAQARLLRFCFAKQERTLDAATDILRNL